MKHKTKVRIASHAAGQSNGRWHQQNITPMAAPDSGATHRYLKPGSTVEHGRWDWERERGHVAE